MDNILKKYIYLAAGMALLAEQGNVYNVHRRGVYRPQTTQDNFQYSHGGDPEMREIQEEAYQRKTYKHFEIHGEIIKAKSRKDAQRIYNHLHPKHKKH